MLKNNFVISLLSVLLLLGFAGIASAGDGNRTDLLGSDQFVFDAPETDSEIAAKNAAKIHVYDQKALDLVGTEAGNWEYTFDTPEHNGTGTMAEHEMKSDAKCSNC